MSKNDRRVTFDDDRPQTISYLRKMHQSWQPKKWDVNLMTDIDVFLYDIDFERWKVT